ncbi:MAG: protein kinase [Bryobacteraceae bacterium]|nr:protein kinase [Bryobacteraceae bacterium]
MTTDQAAGDQIRHWFQRAVDLPTAARQAFMAEHCPDERVRAAVLSLLQYDTSATAQPPVPPEILNSALASALGSPLPAQRIAGGRFELTRLLGSGGMGLVYEAHRVDGEVRQRVAVKFAHIPPAAPEVLRQNAHRRFSRERQMLASLRHPYIAGLIDAGATEDGIPYAVIEQVDGLTIDAYCEDIQASDAEVIHLVQKLCEAVQFAHGNLIVHSDIKPQNVLVTADGIPKLIDFGVASDISGDATLTSHRAFTPAYASPEQATGAKPTVATDVFGLGAILYRLLTGQHPRDVKGASLSETIRQISQDDILPPSTVKPHLRGDLENIILKALQRDPARRYGSALELSDDLARFLERRPVRATPDTAFYRAACFVARRWASLAVAAVLVLTLISATTVALRQRQRALDRASDSRRLAERLLFEVHDEIDGVVGGTKAREKLSAIAVHYLEDLERDYGRDPQLAWELLNAYVRLGVSRGGPLSSVGDSKSALHFGAKALELGAVVEASDPGPDRLDRLFALYENLVPVFQEAARRAEQRETVERLLRIAPRLQPLRQVQALVLKARYCDVANAPQEGAAAYQQALAILRTVPAAPDSQLISTLVGHARARALEADFPLALATLQEALRLARQNASAAPHMAKSSRQLYWTHIAIGDVHGNPLRFNTGRPALAVEHYEQARLIAERLLAADPTNDAAKTDLARVLARQAMALATTDPARSLALYDQSYQQTQSTSGANITRHEARYDYLTASVEPLVALRNFERARSHVDEATRLFEQLKPAGAHINESALRRAAQILLAASGERAQALAEAQKHLALLPDKPNALLSERFETLQALDRIRAYASGIDPAAHRAATQRAAALWQDLHTRFPDSAFIAQRHRLAASL